MVDESAIEPPPVYSRLVPVWMLLALGGAFALLTIAVLLFAVPAIHVRDQDLADQRKQNAFLLSEIQDLRTEAARADNTATCRATATARVTAARDVRDQAENELFVAMLSSGAQSSEFAHASDVFSKAVTSQTDAIAAYQQAVLTC